MIVGKTVRCPECPPEDNLRKVSDTQAAKPDINSPDSINEPADWVSSMVKIENVVAAFHELRWDYVQADIKAAQPEECRGAFLYRLRISERNWQVYRGYIDADGKPIPGATRTITVGEFDDTLRELFRNGDLILFPKSDKEEVNKAITEKALSRAVQIYVAGDDLPSAWQFIKAVQNAYRDLDLHLEPAGPPEIGSLFQKFWIRSGASSDETERLLAKAEVCLQANLMDEPMSRANHNQAGAVAQLMAAAAVVDNFVVLAGSVFMVKYTADNGKVSVLCKTLTPREILAVERNPTLLRSPEAALQHLQELAADGTITLSPKQAS